MAARTRWAARALVLALGGWNLPAAQGRAFDLVRSGSGGGAPGAPASTQAGDAELRAFQRAFRATRDPLEALPAREAALEALRGDQRPAAARALLEAYADLEREVAPVAERHLAAVSIDQGARNAAALRPELDAQRALQDRLLEALLALEGEDARAWLAEQVVDGDELPLGLRLACSDLARGLPPSRSLDRGLERALGRARRAPGEALVALRAITALGPAAAEHERAVIEALEAPSPRVRAAAAGALAALERPAALEPLIEALERERGRNARRMVEALQVLTGQRAGSGAASWRRWLEREGAPFLDGTRPLGGGPATAAADESARYHGIALEGRSILFVLDVSRSMERVLARPDRSAGSDRAGSGAGGRAVRRIDRALEELARALRSLEGVGGDEPVRFGVVAFAGRIETWEDEPVEAEADQLERAIEWVEGLALEHGTSTYGALEVAFQLAGRGAEDIDYEPRYDTLCLLSDGMPRLDGEADSAERIVSAARRWNAAGGLVVHTIGLGDEVPAELMGGLARDSGGRHVLETSAGTVDLSGRPNVVLFVVDDLGWRDVGCAGGELDTPSVDRLAAEGARFDSAYACGPNCAPGRAGLMTGLYGPRHGIYTVLDAARGPAPERALVPTPSATALRPELSTLAEVLAGAGYATAAIGKWHLGDDPREHGFQHALAGDAAGHPRSHFSPYENPALEDGPEGEYLTERLTDEALDFVRSHANGPFFLYLSHYAVHAPLQAPEPLRAKHAARLGEGPRATYAAMVESVDASLGRVLDLLVELDLEERTLVLFTSDNGGLAAVSSMAPLRGEKGTLLEGGLRVPLVIRWPGRVGSGAVVSAPVIGCDLMPTVLQLCAVPCPPVDGESLVPLLQGEGGGRGAGLLEREALFWHFPAYLEPHRDGTAFRARPAGAVRRGRFKLIEHFEDGRLELYDLRDDPGETRDLSAERGELRDELHRLLVGWREQLGAPVPTERNPDLGR